MKTVSNKLLRVTHDGHRAEHVGARASSAGANDRQPALPVLLNVDEAADLLRTSRRAIYAMVERHQLPGVIRVRRRVLFRTHDLLDWLDQKRAPSLQE